MLSITECPECGTKPAAEVTEQSNSRCAKCNLNLSAVLIKAKETVEQQRHENAVKKLVTNSEPKEAKESKWW